MTIHHATVKKAEKLGFIITEVDQGGRTLAQCQWPELNRTFLSPNPPETIAACELVRMLRTEYPRLDLKQNVNLQYSVITNEGRTVVPHTSNLPDITTVIEACQQRGIDLDEEEEPIVEVVASHYKQQYAERGNPNHCGDWLAQQLDGAFVVQEDGKPVFDHEAFRECLVDNDVDMTGKWADLPNSGQKGWVGRYRMNGRQKLEVQVAITGILFLNDQIAVPPEALDLLRTKHAKAVAKATEAHDLAPQEANGAM